MITIPSIPLGENVEELVDWLVDVLEPVTRTISWGVSGGVNSITNILLYPEPIFMVLLFTVVAWFTTKRRGITIFTALGTYFIHNIKLWQPSMETLSLVLFATFVSVLIGIPLGIAAALNKRFRQIIIPILDFMQTLPAFVYLIPAIMFFATGVTPGLFATVIFAIPPAIRLTDLGIRQTPEDLVECADAFGSTWTQKLIQLQLPMAITSIRAGVNQTIMLALSMVVIAGMVGAGGLGSEVYGAIAQVNIGLGFESGLCIVILAIILDRIMQNVGNKSSPARG